MEAELLIARINDTADICERTDKPKFLGFLSAEQAAAARKIMERKSTNFGLWGGFPSAERVMLGCFPVWCDEYKYPIEPITFTWKKSEQLRHRDFLGSFMALGLTRESVGDILVGDGRAVVFVSQELADYVINQLEKIGGTGVKARIGFEGDLPKGDTAVEASCTVASSRLDGVVAALTGISRATAVQKIAEGAVSVNSAVCEKNVKTVEAGDVVTVRGKGKFTVLSLCDKTRKGRLILKYKKYI